MNITIPPAALEAGAISLHFGGWGEADEAEKAAYRETARAAFLAIVEAWPGMLADGDLAPGENGPPLHLVNVIILPLPPQENSNDQ